MMLCCYCYVMLYQCYWPAMLLACGRRWHQVEWIFVRRQSVLQAIQERYYVVWKHFCLSVAAPPFLLLLVSPSPPLILPPSLVLSGHARQCWVALEPANTKQNFLKTTLSRSQQSCYWGNYHYSKPERLPNPHIWGATMLSNHVHKCM